MRIGSRWWLLRLDLDLCWVAVLCEFHFVWCHVISRVVRCCGRRVVLNLSSAGQFCVCISYCCRYFRKHHVVERLFRCFLYAVCVQRMWVTAHLSLGWERYVVLHVVCCVVLVLVDALARATVWKLGALHDLVPHLDGSGHSFGVLGVIDDLQLDHLHLRTFRSIYIYWRLAILEELLLSSRSERCSWHLHSDDLAFSCMVLRLRRHHALKSAKRWRVKSLCKLVLDGVLLEIPGIYVFAELIWVVPRLDLQPAIFDVLHFLRFVELP